MTLPGTEQTSADVTLRDIRPNQVEGIGIRGHLWTDMGWLDGSHAGRATARRTTEFAFTTKLVTLASEEIAERDQGLGTCLRRFVVRDGDSGDAGMTAAI